MRVVYLADAPYIHTRRWIEHSLSQGIECEVLSFRPGEIAGATVHYIDGGEALGKARYLLHARRVRQLIRSLQPDLVHALHLTSYGFLSALADVRPLLISVWGTDILEAPNLTPVHRWLTRFALARADMITATGLHLATATLQHAPAGRQVAVVPYGVDMSMFRPRARRHRKTVVIGAVSRLSVEKGIEYLVEAFALLRRRYGERVVLNIAGDGPEGASLKALAERLQVGDAIDWRGWIEHEELPSFLQGLDIFALPSTYEGFGVAAAEASAMALPIVASRVHGIPDVVLDGDTGLLVPPRDPAALAAALAKLIDDPSLRASMGRRGREYVAAEYDWQKNTAQMDTLYERLTGWQRPNASSSTGNDDERRKTATGRVTRPRNPAGTRSPGKPLAGRRRRREGSGTGE